MRQTLLLQGRPRGFSKKIGDTHGNNLYTEYFVDKAMAYKFFKLLPFTWFNFQNMLDIE